VALDSDHTDVDQIINLSFAMIVNDFSKESPVSASLSPEVFPFDPILTLTWMSPSAPMPERTPDLVFHVGERLGATRAFVVLSPST
jgi:hypothetical protein